MSRRNFILLVIVLSLITAGLLGFLYIKSKEPGSESGPGTNFIAKFNPFKSNVTPTPDDENPQTEIPTEDPEIPGETAPEKFRKISTMPVAGFGLFKKERFKEVAVPVTTTPVGEATTGETKPDDKKPVIKATPPPIELAIAIRYAERATGSIYQTFIDTVEERKFSATTFPKVYDAYFGNAGQSVIMRHLKKDDSTIETFVGTLAKEKLGEDSTESNTTKGSFTVENIKDINISPDGTKIFYLTEGGSGVIGTIMNISDSKKTQIFDSSFTEWLSWWPNKKIITLTTKPSGSVLGYMYTLDTEKKTFTRMLGGIGGLTTLMSPDTKEVLYSNNSLVLSVYHPTTQQSVPLGVRTSPEKCVWSNTSEIVYCSVPGDIPPGVYPDDWYKGEVSFTDQIWKINVRDGNAKIIFDPFTTLGESIDGVKLALDTNEDYLFLINKKDSFLWELDMRP